MKKALSFVSLTVGSIMIASAQVSINVNTNSVAGQGQVNGGALLSLIALAQTIVTRLVPLAVGAAVLALFYFLITFIRKGDNPEEQQKSLKGMLYSIIAIFVMVSIWGLVGLLGSFLGVGQGGSVPVPGIPGSCDATAHALGQC